VLVPATSLDYRLIGVPGSVEMVEIGCRPTLSPNIDSKAVFAQIRGWIKICDQNHEQCPKGSVMPPRRLLEIGDPLLPLHEGSVIQLREDIQERVRYIALSHCWGAKQPFTSTLYTLPKRLESISWSELPKTYQDALHVAQELGIRFVWIDSLCIIQDSV